MNERPHTYRPYGEELQILRGQILEMGGLVEKQIADALGALVRRDSELARETIARDHVVNRMDVEIDELCIRLLALHQPTARDLRLITTGLKITTDLERVGDLAVNICERTVELNEEPQLKPLIDIPHMAAIAQRMLRESLDAFLRDDPELALHVCAADDTIDHLNDQLCRELLTYMAENPQTVSRAVRLSFVAKYLERIADHATNIAEMVVFMVKGTSIRHLAPVPEKV
jgi:phosphate transport system protein